MKNVLTKEKITSNLHIFRFRFSSLGGSFLFGENKSVGQNLDPIFSISVVSNSVTRTRVNLLQNIFKGGFDFAVLFEKFVPENIMTLQ